MRHAFLVIAHNNWWQLKKLIQQLDDESNDIYVHIDKKSKDFHIDDFIGITTYSGLFFYQEYEVFWGGYSQVEVEMYLMDKAHQKGYDYYHIISGADLLLKSNSEIHDFFEKNKGLEFVDINDKKMHSDPEIKRRTKLYHFLQNYRRRYKVEFVNEIFTFLEHLCLVLQIIVGINRTKTLDWKIKYGSNWVSITNSLVEVVLREKDKISKVFSYTNCADELFVQTVAYNCGFEERIYKAQDGMPSNVRYIDWSRGSNGNPYTFKIKDKGILLQNKALFARKFSEKVDKEIIEQLVR
ncbi:MAG: beta-1,6-N-acetylglucosaminyltransferase [Lachnobacterium sp.]|nr:beta-1,6-N-acetylglucosaminyltransferase [Lachnobacterium sp.]